MGHARAADETANNPTTAVFLYCLARQAIDAYNKTTVVFSGAPSPELWAQVAAGMLLAIDLTGKQPAGAGCWPMNTAVQLVHTLAGSESILGKPRGFAVGLGAGVYLCAYAYSS